MIDIKKFLESNKTKLPASFKHAEFSKIGHSDNNKEVSKLSNNSHYKTNTYNVVPFFKDIVRFL